MQLAIVPLIAFVAGVLIWALAKTNAEVKEFGRCLMWCGCLIVLAVAAAARALLLRL